MEQRETGIYTGTKADGGLVRRLDRGIDDMEAGRELPLKDAFRKVEDLRRTRRDARL